MRRTLQQLEQEVLPEFSARARLVRRTRRRRDRQHRAARLGPRALWRYEQKTYLLTFIDVDSTAGGRQRYFLPLTIVLGERSG